MWMSLEESKNFGMQCNARRKCRFKIHCRKLKGEATWQIKSLRLKHICGHQHKNSKITSQYLTERYLEDWRDDPTWKLAFIKRARRECRVEIGYYLAWYARQRAFKMIFGDAYLEYEKVWDYAAVILKYNLGSTGVVKVDRVLNPQPIFQGLYVCFQACKQGFMAGCRPILGVDCAHLKGAYSSILLTAEGKDGNNNIFPVAWAVIEVENGETWTWFLELLRKDIVTVADSAKGPSGCIATVMPDADTRYCFRHIWSYFKNKFPGIVYKEHFWKAARSTIEHHFKQHMQEIKKLSVDAFNCLQAISPAHWSRHKFNSSSKSGMLLNYYCESFNNVLKEARTKPILQLIEWVRRYVMGRFFAKKEGLKSFTSVIMPTVLKMVHRGLQQVSNMRVSQADLMEFEVDDLEYTYVVNLETKSCSCNRWTLMGIPYWHALAYIQLRRLDIENFIHRAYHVETYTKAYAPTFKAMPGHQQWEVTPYPRPLPLVHRNLPGRPSSKKRKKEAGEDKERKNVKREKVKNKCSNCGGLGHYKNKCPSPPIDKPKRQPRRPKKVEAAGQAVAGKPVAGQAAGATSSH
ncbi:uncharacterized protein LOC110706767 [Chenopodium quinoa]|uniref:uncharacterized protein LOC110706767 n=1 Tax=Chenopodium quinoa TaxID=63459 RepID=UPI000B76FC5B|nr:uncharacterized protein LOC110706767 [Chenopodium quinoa]